MRLRERLALTVAPIPLRLALAVAFIYAGLGKLVPADDFTGADAAILAAMGVAGDPGPGPSVPISKPAPSQDEEPAREQPPAQPAETPAAPPASPGGPAAEPPAVPEAPPPSEPLPEPEPQTEPPGGPVLLLVADAAAGDGPASVRASRLHHIAIGLVRASDHGAEGKPLLPAFVGNGRLPLILAWAAAVTELLGGLFMLFGLLTRFMGFALAFTMLVAMWMTTVGPAAMGYAPRTLIVLPAIENYAAPVWQTFMVQLALFGCAAATVFLGAGGASLDRLLFGPRDLDEPGAARAARNLASRNKTP